MAVLSRLGRQGGASFYRKPEIRVLLCGTGRTGVGQTVRLTRIARLLRRVGGGRIVATVATGVPRAADLFGSPDYEIVQLDMPARLTRWGRQSGGDGELAPAALATELLAVIDMVEPHVFVTPHYAGVGGELPRVYAELQHRGARIVLGLRDQYDADDFADRELLVEYLREYIDEVIVWAPRCAAHGIPDEVSSARYTPVAFVGFVGPSSSVTGGRLDPEASRVMTCQVGGGIDGLPVLLAAVAATRRARALGCDVTLELAAGPFTPLADVGALAAELGEIGTISEWVFRDASPPRGREQLRVSMAGYNTCVETACDGVPALLFPRSHRGDLEQARRASWFAASFSTITTGVDDDTDKMAEAIVNRLLSPVGAEMAGLPVGLLLDPRALCHELLGEALSIRVDL